MRLTVLGTATPFPRPDEPCSGYLLEHGDTAIWMDAGHGTLAELLRIRPLESIDAIWVSHRHADHSADVIAAYYALRYGPHGAAAVRLVAPPGVPDRLAAFVGPHAEEKVAAAFPFTPMQGFGDLAVGELALSWAPVQHGVPAFALRVEHPGGVFAYSGDCAPCLSLTEIAEDADVLLCETGYGPDAVVPEVPVHHTAEQAGLTAAGAGARRLLLTHRGTGLSAQEAESRAAITFRGPITAVMPREEYSV